MTREEAIRELREDKELYETDNCHAGDGSPDGDLLEALDMAIEALQFVEHFDLLKEFQSLQEVVRCKDCKYQNECEKIVLFEVTDDEVMGHRVHWCSYGRNK